MIKTLDGDLGFDCVICPVNGGVRYAVKVPEQFWCGSETAQVKNVQFLREEVRGGGMKYSAGWGFIGAEAFGPAGLALGAGREKVTRTIYFQCFLLDGRQFTASASHLEYGNMLRKIQKPYHAKKNEPSQALMTAAIFPWLILGVFLFVGAFVTLMQMIFN